ncbi:hypothetical protein NLG97_g1586 [Lecanicillium saksenae]|uniref:Uncharacterized protein n=1 Tax=Lecanicillium saksenae TaxID=468837 RepID=A0ACC1R3J1_9HYPO|nr:hypothetical protein NLG97_g1586 [Lecanicillium saksenae]
MPGSAMFSQKQNYSPLPQQNADSAVSSQCGDENLESTAALQKHQASLAQAWKIVYLLLFLLCTFVASTILLLIQSHSCPTNNSFFGLESNLPVPIVNDKRTIDDPMWDAPDLDPYLALVALDSDDAKSRGLLTSMHWPWDNSKSIYVLHGFHSLHCLFTLRDAIMEYHDGKNQTWPHPHLTHCLHTLREDIMCAADDTPRYAGRLHGQENETIVTSGLGQNRMCRDWSKLYQYAVENSACYYRPTDRWIPLLDRYKKCPDGSKPWENKTG